MSDALLDRQAHDVRQFNRFYTARIGVLTEGLHNRPLSLAEARVVYELAQHDATTTAVEINGVLRLDPGYLSRILARLQERGLLEKRPSQHDGRQSLLRLTDEGRAEFEVLNASSQSEIRELLCDLEPDDRRTLVESMQTIRRLLGDEHGAAPYVLRPHRPGDVGWIVHRHGALYAEEFQWSIEFEALVAEIAADFMRTYDPVRDRCWIAEMNGENVGCILVARADDDVAKLRLLLVEPKARGLGIGSRLVDEAIRFARDAGYGKAVLWTQSNLLPARRIYERAGFVRTKEEPHHSYGHDLVAETWELTL